MKQKIYSTIQHPHDQTHTRYNSDRRSCFPYLAPHRHEKSANQQKTYPTVFDPYLEILVVRFHKTNVAERTRKKLFMYCREEDFKMSYSPPDNRFLRDDIFDYSFPYGYTPAHMRHALPSVRIRAEPAEYYYCDKYTRCHYVNPPFTWRFYIDHPQCYYPCGNEPT